MTPLVFDAARFRALRLERGGGWGEPLCHYPVTGSTNDEALAAARAGAPGGSLFVADHQASGRGRSGKSWLSKPGSGLLFSVLLRPEASPDQLSALTLAVGLGVRAALAKLVPGDFGVKWPNDVLAAGRKVAGVLCEAQLAERRIEAVVIGVGINLGQQELPPELESSVTSIETLLSDFFGAGAVMPEREALLVEALATIESRVARYFALGFKALHAEFTEHDALLGLRVNVSGATELSGVARGVDYDGLFLIESEGLVIPVRSGTLRVGA